MATRRRPAKKLARKKPAEPPGLGHLAVERIPIERLKRAA